MILPVYLTGQLYKRYLKITFLLSNKGEKIADTFGVAPLVIVPGDELDELLVQRDAGEGIKDGRCWVTSEVGRYHCILGVIEDTLKFTCRSSLDRVFDLIVRSRLLQADDKIDNRDVDGGDAERHTGELAIQRRNNLSDSLSCTGGRRDDVASDGTTTTPVLVGGPIDGLLGSSSSMDSSHQTLDDTKLVVNDLGERSKAVGCAGCVGDDVVL